MKPCQDCCATNASQPCTVCQSHDAPLAELCSSRGERTASQGRRCKSSEPGLCSHRGVWTTAQPHEREHGDWGPCSCGEVMLITASLAFTRAIALGVHLDSVFPSLIQSTRACGQGGVGSDGRHHKLTFQWTCEEGNGREPWHPRCQSTRVSSGVRQRRHGKKPLSPSCSETRLCPSMVQEGGTKGI